MPVAIPAGSLMEACLAGQDAETTLSDPLVLKDAVADLTEVVADAGGTPVKPVGTSAALLVGAAVMSSGGLVRHATMPVDGGSDRKVLLVEAVAVWIWHASRRFSGNRLSADDVRVSHVGV